MIGKIVLTMLVAAAKINQSSIVPAFDQTSRPTGGPPMTWGRALEKALKSKGISKGCGDSWLTPFPNPLMPDG